MQGRIVGKRFNLDHIRALNFYQKQTDGVLIANIKRILIWDSMPIAKGRVIQYIYYFFTDRCVSEGYESILGW